MTPLCKSAALLLLPALLHAQPERFGLPACSAPGTELAGRTYFLLCHDSTRRVPLWTAYELTPDHLLNAAVRPSHFRRDHQLSLPAAADADYRNSGLTRGHMAPARDFAWSAAAIRATFLLSNAVPQYRNPNSGRWAELEAKVRSIARTADAVYIFTGPIFDPTEPKFIGHNQVAVPTAVFKVILVLKRGHKEMFAAIVPNTPLVTEPLEAFTTTVDEVECQSHLDFFAGLDDAEEHLLESRVNLFEP